MCAFIPSFILPLTSYVLIWYDFMIVHDNELFGDFTSVFQNPVAVNLAALSPMAGNPSKISDRVLRYNFAKSMLASTN